MHSSLNMTLWNSSPFSFVCPTKAEIFRTRKAVRRFASVLCLKNISDATLIRNHYTSEGIWPSSYRSKSPEKSHFFRNSINICQESRGWSFLISTDALTIPSFPTNPLNQRTDHYSRTVQHKNGTAHRTSPMGQWVKGHQKKAFLSQANVSFDAIVARTPRLNTHITPIHGHHSKQPTVIGDWRKSYCSLDDACRQNTIKNSFRSRERCQSFGGYFLVDTFRRREKRLFTIQNTHFGNCWFKVNGKRFSLQLSVKYPEWANFGKRYPPWKYVGMSLSLMAKFTRDRAGIVQQSVDSLADIANAADFFAVFPLHLDRLWSFAKLFETWGVSVKFTGKIGGRPGPGYWPHNWKSFARRAFPMCT